MSLPVPAPDSKKTRKIFGVSPNVFFLGVVSLLTDISSEMIFTLLPLFLTNVLGARPAIVGLVGGISDSTDAIFKIFSGWFSDRMGRRKPLTVLGYSLSTVVKPFMYLAMSWGAVLAIRLGDRVGKGFRASPRDALLADSVSDGERGRSFGLHRAMDTSGAFLGLGIAAVIIYFTLGNGLELSLESFRWLVIIGVIPAVIGVLVLLLSVHEPRLPSRSIYSGAKAGWNKIAIDNRFKLFLVIMAVFTLGNSSNFFVILRAQNLGSCVLHVVLMLVLLNATYAAVSMPAGVLSDKLGRRLVIILGWAIYGLVYLGFAFASSLWQIWLLFACYGIYYGLVEGVGRAFVADLVSVESRGKAYGLYNGVVGIVLLPASVIAGWLWQAVSPSATFFFGAGLALLAVLAMAFLLRE